MAFVRHNNNGRRHHQHNNNRGRYNNNSGQQGGNNQQRRHVNRINHVFESNGPEGRIRGTAQQIVEKYTSLARDASASGDKVLMMNYFQHAEHYQRLLNEITEENVIFEREREQARAQQQAQPDLGPEAAEGFVPNDQQPQPQQPQQHQPRRQHTPRDHQRDDRRDNRAMSVENDDDDQDHGLPNFLQVPISTSPPATPAEPVVRETTSEDAAAPRPARAPRTRRVAAPAAGNEPTE